MLHKYVALRAAQLLKSEIVADALQLYGQYGAPAIGQNYNLYQHLAERVLNSSETSAEYAYLAKLRNLLLGIVKSLDTAPPSVSMLNLRLECQPIPQILLVSCQLPNRLIRSTS